MRGYPAMKKLIQWLLSLSLCAGLLAGAAMMYVAWRHNPQCAIHCAGTGVAWGNWLLIGFSWVIPVTGLVLLVLAVPALIIRLTLSRSPGR